MRAAIRRPARVVRSALQRRGFDIVPYPTFARDLVALLERLEVDCVLDVGAFTGTYGRMLRARGYRGRIVSYEPASENFSVLMREAAGDSDWDIHRLAVGSAPAVLDLILTGSAGCNSLLEPNAFAMGELPRMFTRRGVEQVEVTTIDAVFDHATSGASGVFMKVDTQGFDLEVVRGAEGSLPRLSALQVELALQVTYDDQPGYLEMLAELRDKGFHPAQLVSTYRDSRGRIAECDCILVR